MGNTFWVLVLCLFGVLFFFVRFLRNLLKFVRFCGIINGGLLLVGVHIMSNRSASFFKRYLTFKAIRGAGKAGREATGCGMSVFKLLLMICGLLIVCFVFPYVLIAIAVIALVILIVWLIVRKKKK